MIDELHFLAAGLKSRKAYSEITDYIEGDTFSPQGQQAWKCIGTFYDLDPELPAVDRAAFRSRLLKNLEGHQVESMSDYVALMPENVSVNNVLYDLLTHKKNQLGMKIAKSLASNTPPPQDELDRLFEGYRDLTFSAQGGASWVDFDNLQEHVSRENAIPIAPKKLNDRLRGGAIAGDHLLVFGRPEVGKSLFVINIAAKAIKQGYRVLYLGNEEPIYRTAMRIICNLTGATYSQFEDKPKEAVAAARKLGLDNLFAFHMTPGSLQEVELLVRESKPDLVFIDQLSGLDHGESNEVTRLLKLARGFRSMAAKYEFVAVSVVQAGTKSEKAGEEPGAYLNMGDVYGSRTGIPAMCDLMVGVGVNDDFRAMGQRIITLPKNKLGGDHGSFVVAYDEERSRVL